MAKRRKASAKAEVIADDLRNLREALEYTLDPLALPGLAAMEGHEWSDANRARLLAALSHAWQLCQKARAFAQSENELDHYVTIQRKIGALADLAQWIGRNDRDWRQALGSLGIGK